MRHVLTRATFGFVILGAACALSACNHKTASDNASESISGSAMTGNSGAASDTMGSDNSMIAGNGAGETMSNDSGSAIMSGNGKSAMGDNSAIH